MRDLRSELDARPRRRAAPPRTLLHQFGSIAGVRRATREELASAVGRESRPTRSLRCISAASDWPRLNRRSP